MQTSSASSMHLNTWQGQTAAESKAEATGKGKAKADVAKQANEQSQTLLKNASLPAHRAEKPPHFLQLPSQFKQTSGSGKCSQEQADTDAQDSHAAANATAIVTTKKRNDKGKAVDYSSSPMTSDRFARLPEHASAIASTEQDEPRRNIERHIDQMRLLPSAVMNRNLKKPSSEQYHYAKDKLSSEERAQLTAKLGDVIKGNVADPNLTPDQALDMWLSVQHARLRTHTSGQRFGYYLKEQGLRDIVALALLPFAFGTDIFIGMRALASGRMSSFRNEFITPMLLNIPRQNRKDYYRTPNRPEYGIAFNNLMEMLSARTVSHDHKMKIARVLLDQHIRHEGIIAPQDVNPIVAALPGGQQAPERHHTVCKTPAQTADDTPLYQAIIDLAATDYRHRIIDAEREMQLDEAAGADPLGGNIINILNKVNQARQFQGLAPLPRPANRHAYDNEPNARAFSRILERIENPERSLNSAGSRAITPAIKNELYRLAGEIIVAIWSDSDLRKQIFDDSVGGLGTCNNNVVEVFSRLSTKAQDALMIRSIVTGHITPSEFARKNLQGFRLETLENYVAAFVSKRSDTKNVQPEVGLVMKSGLKKLADLPDSVTQVEVEYWSPKKGDFSKALKHVRNATTDPGKVADFFRASPKWREGIIAFTETYNLRDAINLHAFTRMDDFVEIDDQTIMHAETREIITDPSVLQARAAWDALNAIYIPFEEHGKYQHLYSGIDKAISEFSQARLDVEKQLAAYVTPHFLPESKNLPARLPADGGFRPTFNLLSDWSARLATLQAEGIKAKVEEAHEKVAAKTTEIRKLKKKMTALKAEHPDLQQLTEQEIQAGLDKMESRRKQRAAGKAVDENAALPGEGMIALNTLAMQHDKLKREVKLFTQDLNGQP